VLAFTWGGDELRLELFVLGGAGCQLVLVKVLAERDAAAATYRGGWPRGRVGRAPCGQPGQCRWSCQSAGTRPDGPGVGWSTGWAVGSASFGPSHISSALKL
jgi:hypothetical protein